MPPPAPCTTRDSSSIQMEVEKAKTMNATTEKESPMSNAGRRPCRSDTRPQKGALIS